MARVSLLPLNSVGEYAPGTRVLDILLEKECSVMMACGGQGICATCHAYVESGADCLNPRSDREKRTLALITGATEQSRLTCQTRIEREGDICLRLPEVLYAESLDDIEALIGRRTPRAIVHPADGRVLVPAGKIITRSRLLELADVDLSIDLSLLDGDGPT